MRVHVIYFKSVDGRLFKMFASLIFVFMVLPLTFATVGVENSSPHDHEAHKCLLPPYPGHGKYTVSNYPSATPGERYFSVKLDISCDIGYFIKNTIKSIFCINGDWSAPMPKCVRDLLKFYTLSTRDCTLPTDDVKVEYRCLWFPGTLERSRECNSVVPSGTIVRPICRFPAYFSFNILPEMHCRDGKWDYNPICKPACGLTTQHQQLEGTSSDHLELPWHASIYRNRSLYYEHHCGGSLITDTKIISSASCFYNYKNEQLLPASDFVVTVNKMYRPNKDTRDRNRQQYDVTDIKIPSNYQGKSKKYGNDIAIVVVRTPFFFHLSVRPVCLDFDNNLDSTQLTDGNSGKTVTWNWSEVDNDSLVLDVVDISYIEKEDCENMVPIYVVPHFADDVFCARYNKETQYDNSYEGNGLAFLEDTTQRYHLRGVITGIDKTTDGNSFIITYTSIVEHENFIRQNL